MLEKCYYDREKTCRTCASTGSELTSLFAKEASLDGICLSDMIRECTMYTILEDDKLPQHICTACKEKVESAYDFKRQCEESHRKLLSMIQSTTGETSAAKEETTLPDETSDAFVNVRKKSARISAAKKHHCAKCDEIFTKAEQLKIHIKTDHTTVRFKCLKCSKGFTSGGYFKRHMNKFHHKVDTFVEDSNQKAPVKSENVVVEPEISFCNLPKKDNEPEDLDFDFGSDNDDHPSGQDDTQSEGSVKAESTETESKITDSKDPSESLSDVKEKVDDEMETIEKVETESINKENEAAQLTSSQPKKSSFIAPFKSERSFQCDQCEKSFKRKSHLKQHSLCHTKIKPFECSICQKKFGRHDNLKVHMSNHGQKHFQCNTCDRAFGQAYLLKRHKEQTHSEDKPFLCSECGQRFVRNGDLAIHMRRHSGEKPFKCQYCNKGFTRSTEVYVHERYHTGEKKHVCNVCGKAFQRPYNLLVHVRTHTGERPYQCPHCPKNFTQCSDLKAHIRRHTGERYRCDQCGRGFIHVFVLNQHKLTVHGIEVQSRIKRVAKLPDANTQ